MKYVQFFHVFITSILTVSANGFKGLKPAPIAAFQYLYKVVENIIKMLSLCILQIFNHFQTIIHKKYTNESLETQYNPMIST